MITLRTDPSHFTNNEIFQVLASQLSDWYSTNVCQDRSLEQLAQSFDFSVAPRGEQEVCANGMSATIYQVETVLAYFNLRETELTFPIDPEESTVVERRTELYSLMFELLKRDDGLFAFSSSAMAQIGLRWLAFIIPPSLLEQFVPEQGQSNKTPARLDFDLKLLMLLGEYIAVANPAQRAKYATFKTKELRDMRTALNRVDSIRRGRNYIMKSDTGK